MIEMRRLKNVVIFIQTSYGFELNKNFRAIEKKDTFLKNSNKNFFWLLQRKYYTVLFCHLFYNNLGKTKLTK